MYKNRNNGGLIELFYNEYCIGYDPNAVVVEEVVIEDPIVPEEEDPEEEQEEPIAPKDPVDPQPEDEDLDDNDEGEEESQLLFIFVVQEELQKWAVIAVYEDDTSISFYITPEEDYC